MANINLRIKPQNIGPPGPTAWEKFLVGAGVSETNCISILVGRTNQGDTIRRWIEDHYATSYVPEHVLEILGLHYRLNFD